MTSCGICAIRRFGVGIIYLSFIIHMTGCTTPAKNQPLPQTDAPDKHWTGNLDLLQTDPLAVLKAVADRADKLPAYRMLFIRQERRGLANTLRPPEHIRATFRADPFSVKFQWLDEDSSYTDAVYVAGQHDNKLRVRQRKGLFGLPPATLNLNPMDTVTLGASRNPITDFGLARLIQRALGSVDVAKEHGGATAVYAGIHDLPDIAVQAHRIDLTYPKAPGITYQQVKIHIDQKSHLPAGAHLFLPDGELSAVYQYGQFDLHPNLTDADFDITPPKNPNPD
jgi:hypothetical protein